VAHLLRVGQRITGAGVTSDTSSVRPIRVGYDEAKRVLGLAFFLASVGFSGFLAFWLHSIEKKT